MKLNLPKMRFGILLTSLALSAISFSQTIYTFTSGTATGNVGPTQAEMDIEYTGTSLDGDVTVTAGIQFWVVPVTGPYSIECFGGQGYGAFGGRGAHITGEFNLTAGDTIKLLVGQMAGNYFDWPNTGYNHQYGGGGGSFATYTNNTPLVVAGGGGGSHAAAYFPQNDGQITEAGAAGFNASITGVGGTAGQGGAQASSADGGGGILTSGAGLAGGISFINGGLGGIDEGTGGFGCGGGTSSWNNYRGGGGGGYSGGGGANNSSLCCPSAGGGGSYNNGTNPSAIAGVQLGDGMIVITSLCSIGVASLIPDLAILGDVTDACIVSTLVDPMASNNCFSVVGTSNATLPITTIGTTVVTWTYNDGTNSITQDQNVIITGNDVTPPTADVATLTDVSTADCSYTPASPTATDFCAGVITGTPDVTFPISTQGATVVTWTYDDGNGNTVTQTQTITLNDVTMPVLDVDTLSTYSACFEAIPPTPTAMDSCAGVLNGTPDVTFPITTAGLTVVTWTYDDGNGNTISQTQDVMVATIDLSTTVTGPTISADAAGLIYQWVDCATNSAINGETNQSYTPSVVGDFAVIITGGGCSDTSACALVNYAGINELNSELINIYPNPTNTGLFTVDFDGNLDQIVVIDALGREINLPINLTTGEVNGSSLAQGKYIVKVVTLNAVYTKQIVVID